MDNSKGIESRVVESTELGSLAGMSRTLIEENDLYRYFDTNTWKYDSCTKKTTLDSYTDVSTWILLAAVVVSLLLFYYVWNVNKSLLEELYSKETRSRYDILRSNPPITGANHRITSD